MASAVVWQDDEVALVKRLYEAGLSASQMAAEVSAAIGRIVSRNSVIGILHRKGIGGRAKPKAVPRPPKPRVRKIQVVRPTAFGVHVIESSERADKLAMAEADVQPRNVAFADLGHGECRYPYGDSEFTFCGHAALEGFSYCGPHHRLTHTSARITAEEVSINRRLHRRKMMAEAA